MSVPGIVQSAIGDEAIVSRVSIGGDDELFVTPSSTLLYRSEGLLSDEAIEEYEHDADRLTVSEGRRKTTVTLEYSIDGAEEFTIPASKTEAVLEPVLGGVLEGNGITAHEESVVRLYRFSELTLILTTDRLVKHVGEGVWDEGYEEYHFGDVTNLSFEDGSVATQIVLEVGGRPQRIKAPNDEADDLRERLERALFDYHGVASLAELNETLGPDEEAPAETASAVDFGDGVDPLETDDPESDDGAATEEAGTSEGSEPQDPVSHEGAAAVGAESILADSSESEFADAGSPDASSGDGADPELVERLDALETAVERQSEIIENQQETIDQLIDELRRGR